MSLNKLILIMLMILFLLTAALWGAFDPGEEEEHETGPFFRYKILSYPMISRDSVNVKITLDVPYNEIQFIKEGDLFRAEYEATVLVLNEKEEHCFSKTWNDTITLDNYEQTNSMKKFVNTDISFNLIPNKIKIKFGIIDLNSKNKKYLTKTYDFQDYYKESMIISELKIVEQEEEKKDTSNSEYNIFADSTQNDKKLFLLTYQLLSDGGVGRVNYQITDEEGTAIFNQSYDKFFSKGITDLKFLFDARNLQYKEYNVSVKIRIDEKEVERSKKFQIRWSGMNLYIRNLPEAIEQLVYITDSKTMKKLRKAKGEEQKDLFVEFWKTKDPTPGTVKNELLNEYYSRVRFAELTFKGYRTGWRSDMGMVYILFGAPDNIERHPFEVNSRPYEIWYYNDKGKVFYFVDESGFGEYRLANPSQIYY
ncbi:MAG: GWxTD domain-containing protein [Candidatus Marinimicrobia bacterium]|nr:GWxTD domain-containing protein [Candidatus Neomarinimicrobiota bacterium]